MRLTLCAFVAGCWLVQQLPALPAASLSLGAALAGLGVLLALSPLAEHRSRSAAAPLHSSPLVFRARLLTTVLAAAMLGAAWAAWRAERRLAERLVADLEGVTLSLTGVVSSLPTGNGNGSGNGNGQGMRFHFTVDGKRPVGLPALLSLGWQQAPPDLLPGTRLALTVRLKRPHGLANPHGFDYEYWLLQRGIGATGYVLASRPAAQVPLRPAWRIARWRARMRARMLAAMPPDAPFAGVLVALAIGDQSGIAAEQWRWFTRTGIGHLVSISGLHITMVSGLAGALARALWRRSFGVGRWLRRPLPLRCPAQRAAALVAVAAALAYGLLSGMEVPAQRTVAMVSVAALALWWQRRPPASLVLAWAAAVALALDPWAVRAAGFWLSFGAVAAIFLAASQRTVAAPGHDPSRRSARQARWHGLRRHLAEAVRTQWAVTVGLLPPTLLLFQQVSVVSPLANALAIPLVSLLVTPLALGAALLAVWPADWPFGAAVAMMAALLLTLAHQAMAWLAAVLVRLAAPNWAVWQAARPDTVELALAMLGTAVLLAPRAFGWGWRVHGVVLLIPMLSSGRAPLPAAAFRATALDVGQGAAVLIETRSHRLLYDTGPAYGPADSPRPSAGERVVVPFLRAIGVHALDALVISHEDADHAGGARDVMAALPVRRMWASLPRGHPLWQLPPGVAPDVGEVCAAGIAWQWDGVRFELLHPLPGQGDDAAIGSNARSCVLRISSPHAAMLLAGDIDRDAELAMVGRLPPDALRADLLLVPHHGSRTSSSDEWLDAVAPTAAVFQLGYRNRYRHPHAQVWARYGRRGIARYRSDRTGAVELLADRNGIAIASFRQQARRYWRPAPDAPE
ncbi:DNA internalization-related competence protein ComEC/Rec2 [Cupriavidus gilardii]|uniref:DNA internalization-related competence protein ComEC/Rec2 n=1 Tax=Cupriavidus gilardii TaxID=82541 RepID=UPI001ABDFC1E|nr:DNA internalization-related competence protein ComEC/Rec2 [Cupriavidus gilardii]MBO4120119.1 DNA internalization-related competence protein ComEC/Rec2 [Cupriavidus gilardii]